MMNDRTNQHAAAAALIYPMKPSRGRRQGQGPRRSEVWRYRGDAGAAQCLQDEPRGRPLFGSFLLSLRLLLSAVRRVLLRKTMLEELGNGVADYVCCQGCKCYRPIIIILDGNSKRAS